MTFFKFKSLQILKHVHYDASSKVCALDKTKGYNGIYEIALNRLNAKNAINTEMINQLLEYFKQINQLSDASVLIIRSNVSNVFCSGADLKERSMMPVEQVGPHVTKLRNLFQTLYNIPIPTIAAIDGIAFGGGLEMCLACDIRIASPFAKMGLVETTLGIIPGAGGTQRLPRLIGISKAKELIFTGAILDAQMALHIGLVNDIAPINKGQEQSMTLIEKDPIHSSQFPAYNYAINLAKSLMERCAPLSLRYAKKAINEGMETDLLSGLKIEEAVYNKIIYTADRDEGLKAFMEKRQPKYRGF